MKIGTRSLLYGVHMFWWHPILLFRAWWKLFGFPWRPQLWVAFLVHDWGYWGKPDMDGPKGEMHITLGASIMRILFDDKWARFCLLHSRFIARSLKMEISALGIADKYAFTLEPRWFYLLRGRVSGEIREFQQKTRHSDDTGFSFIGDTSWKSDCRWYDLTKQFLISWCMARIHYADFELFGIPTSHWLWERKYNEGE